MIPDKRILKGQLITFFAMFFFLANSQNPFIENKGQFPESIISKTNLPSGALFIEKGKLIYTFYNGKQLAGIHDGLVTSITIDAHAYSVSFLNSNTEYIVVSEGESEFFENYYLGDKLNWATEVKSYQKQRHKEIYENIDVSYYVQNDYLKYEFIIAKHGNPQSIKMQYKGVNKLSLNNGKLLINTSVNKITEHKPYAYQMINNIETEVACNYKLNNKTVSFNFPEGYNSNYELIIDPILEFSTYSGSTADNFGYTATYDNFGFLYAGSSSFGTGYPTTIGAYQINYANTAGGTDVAITKYDTTGTQKIYSTYLGGSLDELPHSMIVNSANELFIYGTTASADFPTTTSSYQPNFNGGPGFSPSGIGVSFPNGSDIFVSRLSANGGNLLASTFIGGTGNDGLNTAPKLKFNYADEVRGEIDIDNNNNIYIATCTKSTDFPTLNSLQMSSSGNQEGCIIKMDNQLTTIIWSTYLGGANDDAIYSLALDENDNIYVTGGTNSSDFPTTTNAYQNTYQDSTSADAFITKISSNGSQILSSSYFGTDQYDQSYFVEIGSTNAVYLFGQTKNIGSQLVNNAAYSVEDGGQFIAVFNEDLSDVIRSTTVGTGKGTPDISPTAFLVDVCDKIYIAGWGSNIAAGPLSTLNLPISANAYQQNTDGNDFYLMVLDEDLSSMIYATYFGGSQSNEHVDGGTSRFDKKGIIYQSVCAGCGGNSDFPIEPNPGAVSATNNSLNCNNGVFKFNFDFPMVVADFDAPWVGCTTSISFQNLTISSSTVSYSWNFGDGSISTNPNPTHNYTQNGLYNVTLIVSDISACNAADTIVKQIYILSNSSDTIHSIVKCPNEQIQIGLLPVNDPTITYFWVPSADLSSTSASNPLTNTTTDQQYQLLISNGSCTDTLFQDVIVTELNLDAGNDTSYCNIPILLSATLSNNVTSVHWSSNDSFIDTLSTSGELIIESADMFYVKASDGYCEVFDSVEVLAGGSIDVFADDVCVGDSSLVGVTNLNPIIPIISYNWNATSLDVASFIDFPDSSKWYTVEVINSDGCIVKDSSFVNIYEYPILDSIWASETVVFKGEEISLNVISYDNISWDNFENNNYTQILVANYSQCYIFEIDNQHKCIIQDSICVEVKDVFCNEDSILIPTAFSPNEDKNRLNETYFIKDKAGVITKFRLEIFNRLGQKVFSSTTIAEEWDGTFKGKKLSPQVFDFYLDLECIGRKTLFRKGNITLIR